jgi:hypothetical protein
LYDRPGWSPSALWVGFKLSAAISPAKLWYFFFFLSVLNYVLPYVYYFISGRLFTVILSILKRF